MHGEYTSLASILTLKNAFFAFLLRKNYLWPETGTGGLIDPWG